MPRRANGQFEKGTSGNPSGRPKRSETETEMIEQICSLAPQAITTLKGLMESDFTSDSVRLKCCELIMQRVCGRIMSADELREYEAPPNPKTEAQKKWDELEAQLLDGLISH